MNIEAKKLGEWEHFNITGGKLRTKFSIVQKSDGYHATSAKSNSELIQFLDGLREANEKHEYNKYWWWKLEPTEVIFVINAVIRKFK